VATVCNGREAQAKAKEAFFDIAFVDVHMPVMDGIKTLKMLRENSPQTTVVMMDSMPGYALDAFRKEGAVTCIHKPFNIKEVRSVVDEIIKKGRIDD
jgi:CheY-like chemotaxis protein